MSDEPDFYADDYIDFDYEPSPPKLTPAQRRERLEHLKREWAALTKQSDDKDDVIDGWPIPDAPPTQDEAGTRKKGDQL